MCSPPRRPQGRREIFELFGPQNAISLTDFVGLARDLISHISHYTLKMLHPIGWTLDTLIQRNTGVRVIRTAHGK